jgi:hypothetical protein
MKFEKPEYEYPIQDLKWTGAIGHPAGLYWLDGRCIIVAHDSPAEHWLLARGAILAATLRFDADPLERSHRGRDVVAFDDAAALRHFAGTTAPDPDRHRRRR